MGLVGRYIDALRDEQRDRVIEADGWSWQYLERHTGCRCLVGHAENWVIKRTTGGTKYGSPYYARDVTADPGCLVANRVPDLFIRFGMNRVVPLLKARAARGNNIARIRAGIYAERKEATRLVALL